MELDHNLIKKWQQKLNPKFVNVNKKIGDILEEIENIFNKDEFCRWIGLEKLKIVFEKEKKEKQQKQLEGRKNHYLFLFEAFNLLGKAAGDWEKRPQVQNWK